MRKPVLLLLPLGVLVAVQLTCVLGLFGLRYSVERAAASICSSFDLCGFGMLIEVNKVRRDLASTRVPDPPL